MILIDSLSFFLLFFKYKGASILSDIHIVSTTSVRPQIFLEGFYWSHKTMDILRLVQWDSSQLKLKVCYWTTGGKRQHAICFYSVDWTKLMRHDLFDKSLFCTINTAKYIWCAMRTVPQILISISANFLY